MWFSLAYPMYLHMHVVVAHDFEELPEIAVQCQKNQCVDVDLSRQGLILYGLKFLNIGQDDCQQAGQTWPHCPPPR